MEKNRFYEKRKKRQKVDPVANLLEAAKLGSIDYGEAYGLMHENQKWFLGTTVKRYVDDIAKLVAKTSPRRILDYGCGKGMQYLKLRIQDQWGGMLPYCYDVGVRSLADRPEGKFDGIICTDMLEHIFKPDVPSILKDILSLLTDDDRPTFVLLSVACRPADHKRLPDGRNVHLTVEPAEWWRPIIKETIRERGLKNLTAIVAYEHEDGRVTREEISL